MAPQMRTMRFSAVAVLATLWAPMSASAQLPGVYDLRLDSGVPEAERSLGLLVLAPGALPAEALPEALRTRQLELSRAGEGYNACSWLPRAPAAIGDRSFYAGIKNGPKRWEQMGDTVRLSLYRSPDASATVSGVPVESGFAGTLSQHDASGRHSGPWLPFTAVRLEDWHPGACSDLGERAENGEAGQPGG